LAVRRQPHPTPGESESTHQLLAQQRNTSLRWPRSRTCPQTVRIRPDGRKAAAHPLDLWATVAIGVFVMLQQSDSEDFPHWLSLRIRGYPVLQLTHSLAGGGMLNWPACLFTHTYDWSRVLISRDFSRTSRHVSTDVLLTLHIHCAHLPLTFRARRSCRVGKSARRTAGASENSSAPDGDSVPCQFWLLCRIPVLVPRNNFQSAVHRPRRFTPCAMHYNIPDRLNPTIRNSSFKSTVNAPDSHNGNS
jgi:hypothetical protein